MHNQKKQRKYLDLREELKNIEVGLFLYIILHEYKEKLEKSSGRHTDSRRIKMQAENQKMDAFCKTQKKSLKEQIDADNSKSRRNAKS